MWDPFKPVMQSQVVRVLLAAMADVNMSCQNTGDPRAAVWN